MRAWRHLLLLTALAVGAVFLIDLLSGASIRAGGWAGAPRAALGALPDILVPTLAVALAIAVGTLPPDQRHTRQAAHMTAVVSLAALVLDLVIPASRSLPVIVGAFTGSLGDFREVVSQYPMEHPRWILVSAVQRSTMLLAPVVLAGIALGVGAWIHTRVIFRTPRDGTVARWVVSWIMAPGTLAFVMNWSQGIGADVLFRGASSWQMLVPWATGLVVAVLGWRASARTPMLATAPAPSN